jgi:hypothetical protein
MSVEFNILFDRKFSGCPMLGTMYDEARDRTMKLFYVNMEGHVGVFDGVDTWISPIKGCFRQLKEGFLQEQILLAQQGKIGPEPLQRHKRVIVVGEQPVARAVLRKVLLKKRELSHG